MTASSRRIRTAEQAAKLERAIRATQPGFTGQIVVPVEAAPAKVKAAAEPKVKAPCPPCLCGCGQLTRTAKTAFRPGHDARVKAELIKHGASPIGLRPELLAALERGPLASFALVNGTITRVGPLALLAQAKADAVAAKAAAKVTAAA